METVKPLVFVNDNVPFGARGMERYFRHVTAGIVEHFGPQALVFSPRGGNYAPAHHVSPLRFKGSEQIRLHDFLAQRAVRSLQPQLVFSAWFNQLRTPAKQVFVVYDAIFEKFPQYHARWQTPLRDLAQERRRALERADRVIAISHSTAQDLLALYPQVTPAKLTVIYLGVDDLFFDRSISPIAAPARPYFLFVGFRSGHKNFARLLAAFGQSGLAAAYDLRVVSGLPFIDPEVTLMRQYGIEAAVIWLGSQNEAGLRAAYQDALALVYPSEYEGFGLPILEAFAAGTLVLTANLSSMPEIGAAAPLYFDPYRVDSIVTCLHQAVQMSSAERTARIAQGVVRAREFTWARCQHETVQLLASMLD